MSAHHSTNRIIQSNLVIQIVKISFVNVIPILRRVIDLSDKHHIRLLLHLWDHPFPELHRHHLGHVATETIYSLLGPKAQDIQHFMPSIWNFLKMAHSAMHIIHAIIELHRLIPIILTGISIKVIVASDLSRELAIRIIFLPLRIKTEDQGLSWQVVEIIIDVKRFRHVIMLTQILHERLTHIREILSSHMIGHEINNHFQTCVMRTTYQILKLPHAVMYIIRQIGIYIVIIFDCIRRPSVSFDNRRMIFSNAISRIIGLRRMLNHARVPNMRDTQLLNLRECQGSKSREFADTIFRQTSVFHWRWSVIPKPTRENLINNHFVFLFHCVHNYMCLQEN